MTYTINFTRIECLNNKKWMNQFVHHRFVSSITKASTGNKPRALESISEYHYVVDLARIVIEISSSKSRQSHPK